MAGDAGRLWRMKNLLVDFDENGAVSSREVVPDDKLWKTLRAHISGIHPPTLDLSKPVHIVLTSPDPIAIQMDPNYMEFERTEDSGKPNVQVPVTNVVRFKHNSDADGANSPSITCDTLELSEKTVFGKKIKFCSDAAQIGILFEYLQQSASPTMRWE